MPSTEFYRKPAFIFRAEDVHALWTALRAFGSPVAHAKCADEIKRTFDTADELIAYSNSRARSIQSVQLTATSDDFEKSASIYLNTVGPLWVRAEGAEQLLAEFRATVSEIYDGMRPWYSVMTRIEGSFLLPLILVGGFLAFGRTIIALNLDMNAKLTWPEVVRLTFISLAIVCGLLGVTVVLSKLLKRYFPMHVFALGQGLERYRVDDKVRWTIFVGFAVSIVATIATAIAA